MRILATALSVALAFAFVPLTAQLASADSIIIRNDSGEFCMGLDDDGEWFIGEFDNSNWYSSSEMDKHLPHSSKGSFKDRLGIFRNASGPLDSSVRGKYRLGASGKVSFVDHDSDRQISIRTNEVVYCPIGCFDPGRC
jgi:hypothetical protein